SSRRPALNSEPGPPSSHSPSEAQLHVSVQLQVSVHAESSGPQSVQSLPYPQSEYSAPGPPSSHEPSDE
ncbi:hypothetical protein Ctob_004996, partial [Chrysochromulina tobinii]